MPFEIKYDEKQHCIFATFTGKITMELTREYIAALLPILEETGCQRLLSDSREAELNLSSLDILQFPKLAAASPLTARCKRAVLPPRATSGFDVQHRFVQSAVYELPVGRGKRWSASPTLPRWKR